MQLVAFRKRLDIIYYERKEAAEAATRAARVQDILDLLAEHGAIPETVKLRLKEEEDTDILKHWLKLAAKADSIEAFCAMMDKPPARRSD